MSTPTPNAQMSPHEQGWTSSLPGAKLRRVTQYIQDNADKDLTLAALAAVVNMSPYHFARLFRHSTGVPPHRFVVRQRIDHAIALLMSGEPSITRIAQIVGFRTSSHFSTVFRRATGTTPTAFRARKLADERPAADGGHDATA
jgi:AraC family transcriptional regulator